MVTIGCDFGLSKSGIVVIDDQFEIKSQNLIKVRSKGAQRLIDIESAFDSIVRPFLSENQIDVFVEGYAYGAKYQRESLAELGGVMRRYLHLAKLNFWVIPPTSLKLFVTGTGKASKNYMKKCTKEKWDEIFKSDDVCDAYGLARLGMCIQKALNGVQGFAHLPANERDIVKDILLNQEYFRNGNTAKTKRPRTANAQRTRTTKSRRSDETTNSSGSNS